MIRGDGVEVIEVPHLAQKYQVMGVPRTVVNEDIHVEGAVPEQALVPELVRELTKAEKK